MSILSICVRNDAIDIEVSMPDPGNYKDGSTYWGRTQILRYVLEVAKEAEKDYREANR